MTSKLRLLNALTQAPQSVVALAASTRIAEGRVRILAQTLVDEGRARWADRDRLVRAR